MPSTGVLTAEFSFGGSVAPSLDPAVVAPPSTIAFLKRRSVTMPAPVLNSVGTPVDWVPVVTATDLGRPRLIFNGVDVTYYRGVVSEIGTLSSEQPFGDTSARFRFPQVSPLEVRPSWLAPWVNVEVRLVLTDSSEVILWEGLLASEEDSLEGGSSVECIGALFQADLLVKPPTLNDGSRGEQALTNRGLRDIGRLIAEALDVPSLRFGALVSPPGSPIQTGITSSERGSFDTLLRGYIQSLLSPAFSVPLLADGEIAVDIETSPDGEGYWILGSLGSIIPFGFRTAFHGSMLGIRLNEAASGITARPDSEGYWYSAEDGGVFTFNGNFYGSQTGNPNDVEEIQVTPSGAGYWLLDDIGGIFTFGDAGYFGNAVAGGGWCRDFVCTPSGLGYWIVDTDGIVYALGNAIHYGNATSPTNVRGIEATPSGLGYWLVNEGGQVYAFGDAVHYGNTPSPLNRIAVDIAATPSGLGYRIVAEDGGVFAFGDASYLGNGFDGRGEVHQWTLAKSEPRTPVIKVKDRRRVLWTVDCGAPGVDHQLSHDYSMSPNAQYGEGVNAAHGRWRNTKLPSPYQGTVPTLAGSFGVGASGTDVTRWQTEMHRRGWPVTVDGSMSEHDASVARRFQAAAGLGQTGVVDQATWDATFASGDAAVSTSLLTSFIAPLYVAPAVEPWLYAASGAIIGPNPAFDPGLVRIERYANYGDGIEKVIGERYAESEVHRDSVAPWVGSLRLLTDPHEGSRFLISEGDNLRLRYHQGVTRVLHVVSVTKDLRSLEVSLDLDERARDAVTLAAILDRDRNASDPGRRRTYRNTKSQETPDNRAVWDSESGAGVIPALALAADTWKVYRFPAGEFGEVVRTVLQATPVTTFAAGVFDRDPTPMSGNPLTTTDYWDSFVDSDGLLIAWGDGSQRAGYHPKLATEAGAVITGLLDDSASFNFQSSEPPWLWLAVFADIATSLSGRFYPGADT